MKRLCLYLLLNLAWCAAAWSQSNASQVLVFRKDGEVNLFYGEEIDSMVLSKMDADSVEHEDYVSQVFYAKDTVAVIPIAEIDSVAFGSRNVMEFRDGVVVIDEEHRSYITSYNINSMIYKSGTPADILPERGQVLFYNVIDDMFPAGLVARVTAVAATSDSIVMTLEKVELEDVFSRLFYAGDGSDEDAQQMQAKALRAPAENPITHYDLEHSLEIADIGSMDISGPLDIIHRFVVNPLKHYYHTEFGIDATTTFDMSLHTVSRDYSDEPVDLLHIPLPNVALVLWPVIKISLFIDYEGEINGNLTTVRNFNIGCWWTRKNGVNTSGSTTPQGDSTKNKTISNKASLTVDGILHTGVSMDFEIGIVGQYGVVGKVKVGPCVSSQFGIGAVQTLATSPNENDRLSAWAAASFSACTRLAIETDIFNPEHVIWGERDETPIFKLNLDFHRIQLSLLPYFMRPCAVSYPHVTQTSQRQNVSVAVKDTASLVAPVEVGFEIDNEEDEALDSIFVNPTPQTADSDIRAYATEISVDVSTEKTLKMVPVVHYADYTLRYVPTSANRFGVIQPIVSFGSNGVTTFVSGSPVIGQMTNDSTVYFTGNYLPVNYVDTMYVEKRAIISSFYISDIEELIGVWIGDDFTLTFTDIENGTYMGDETKAFEWALDDPQTGDITLYFSDEENSSVYSVVLFSDEVLKLKDKRTDKEYTFTKE